MSVTYFTTFFFVLLFFFIFFFFFQAEDGIRDATVTGVQTCALPIYTRSSRFSGSGGIHVAAVTAEEGFVRPRFSLFIALIAVTLVGASSASARDRKSVV